MPALFDTHVHTSEVSPCGHVPGREMANLYSEAGYDGVVVTDHFTINVYQRHGCNSWAEWIEIYLSGFRKASAEGHKIGLKVLWAIELELERGPRGHFLVYGVDAQFLLDHPDIFTMNLGEFRQCIDNDKMLIYQAHPYRNDHVLSPVELLDGIEVVNGNPRHFHDSVKAIETATRHDLLQIAGSDAHQPVDVGRAGISLPHLPASIDQFVRIQKNETSEIVRFCEDVPVS